MPVKWKEDLFGALGKGVVGGVEVVVQEVFRTVALQLIAKVTNSKDLSPFESRLVSCIYRPNQNVSVDVAGLDNVLEDLARKVLLPLREPNKYLRYSKLLAPTTGVLLYGPPGTGKTTIAKMIANDSGIQLLMMTPSILTSKWSGESEKLVSAMFSLARRLEPCIIFIDEIDSLMGTRSSNEASHVNSFKSEFLAAWDGIASSSAGGAHNRILVLGSTNRKDAIDPAFLRRMPTQKYIGLPNHEQRVQLMETFLDGTSMSSNFDWNGLAYIMDGLSGSDIKHCCSEACRRAYQAATDLANSSSGKADSLDLADLRPVVTSDFLENGTLRDTRDRKPIVARRSARSIHSLLQSCLRLVIGVLIAYCAWTIISKAASNGSVLSRIHLVSLTKNSTIDLIHIIDERVAIPMQVIVKNGCSQAFSRIQVISLDQVFSLVKSILWVPMHIIRTVLCVIGHIYAILSRLIESKVESWTLEETSTLSERPFERTPAPQSAEVITMTWVQLIETALWPFGAIVLYPVHLLWWGIKTFFKLGAFIWLILVISSSLNKHPRS